MSKIQKPTVLITGCTDGSIGHGLAIAFASQNYHVFATTRRLSSMASLKDLPNITLLELDVTSPASIRAAYSTVSSLTSRKLDILYNNAGVRYGAMAIESSVKTANDTFAVNFTGVVEMVHVFYDLVIAAKGKIVFTGSGAGMLPVPTGAMYNASKAALDSYADTLRLELKPFGVAVVNVITGMVETAMTSEALLMPPLDAGSVYKPIEKELNQFWLKDNGKIPVAKYANMVVKKVIRKKSPARLWMNSELTWWFQLFHLMWVFDIIFEKEFGLNKKLEKIKA